MYGFIATSPKNKHDVRTSLLDKTFKDKDGRVYIAAVPNIPLATWIIASLAAMAMHGTLHKVFAVVAFAALSIWAALEIYSGVNYFRRALGIVVGVGLIFSLLR